MNRRETYGIANHLHFEHFASIGDAVKCLIDILQQNKDLCQFATVTPSRETGNVHKQDSHIEIQVSNGSLIHGIIIIIPLLAVAQVGRQTIAACFWW